GGGGAGSLPGPGGQGGGRPVGSDDRRARVETAEVDPGDLDLGRCVTVQAPARRGPGGLPRRAVLLERGWKGYRADRVGHGAREAGVAQRDRLALGLVAREQLAPAPALANRGELPAEVGGGVHRGVVALATGRGEEVSRVARDEGAASPETLGDEGEPRGPLGDPQDLEGKLASGCAQERLAGVRAGVRALARQLNVEHPQPPAVDRVHQRALL